MTHTAETTILAIRATCVALGHGSREARRQIARFNNGDPLSLGIRAHVAHLLNEYGDADSKAREAMREAWRDRWEEFAGEALPE